MQCVYSYNPGARTGASTVQPSTATIRPYRWTWFFTEFTSFVVCRKAYMQPGKYHPSDFTKMTWRELGSIHGKICWLFKCGRHYYRTNMAPVTPAHCISTWLTQTHTNIPLCFVKTLFCRRRFGFFDTAEFIENLIYIDAQQTVIILKPQHTHTEDIDYCCNLILWKFNYNCCFCLLEDKSYCYCVNIAKFLKNIVEYKQSI